MIAIILSVTVILLALIKTINYGRWAGKQGNLRGAVGLYLLALLCLLIPTGVYLLNKMR